jgi:CRISPR-associated endonuclease/helicase Cas3
LRAHSPLHAALLGPYQELIAVLRDSNGNTAPGTPTAVAASPAEQSLGAELAELSAEDFDLVAWLVCSHHGKVRCSWTSTPKDQEAELGCIHGVKDGDELRSVELMGAGSERLKVGRILLDVDTLAAIGLNSTYGDSWRERVEKQLRLRGPFQLAYLEALFRAADWRASASSVVEELA